MDLCVFYFNHWIMELDRESLISVLYINEVESWIEA